MLFATATRMSSRNTRGAASAAPRPSKAARTIIEGPAARAAWKNEDVIAWTMKRVRKKAHVADLIRDSAAGKYDWPIPGQGLGQNAAEKCKAIAEDRIGRDKAPRKKRESGGRLRALHMQRKVEDSLLLQARIDIEKMVGHLEIIDFPFYGIRDATPDTVSDIYRDLTRLTAWLDQDVPVVAAEMNDLKKIELIRKLRATNGRDEKEAESYRRMADKLENERLGIGA
jgi:hypothetical protein